MAERYGERMSDRMPDRMGDRMSDRMSDRMNDRMGPSQSGFLWEEKQRSEAGMRGEGGRGRDMRGSGAPPLQPPPVPPSAMSSMERGGPSVASAAAQSSKSSPKPLMGSGGFGNQTSGGPGQNSSASGADSGNQMKMDFLQPAQDECHNTENIHHHEVPASADSKITFQLAQPQSVHEEIDSALPSYSDELTTNEDQQMADLTASDDEQPGLWETEVDYRSSSPNSSVTKDMKTTSEPTASYNHYQLIETDISQNKDITERKKNCSAKGACCGIDSGNQSVFNSKNESLKSNGDVLISEISSPGNDFSLLKDCVKDDATIMLNISNKSLATFQKENSDQYMSVENEKQSSVELSSELSSLNDDIELDASKIRVPLQRYLSADNVSEKQESDGKLQRYLSADNVNCDLEPPSEEKLTDENYLVSDSCQSVVLADDSYQSTEAISLHTSDLTPQYSLKNSHTNATSVERSSKSPDKSAPVQDMCNISSDKYESSSAMKLNFPFSCDKPVNKKSDDPDYHMSDNVESDYKQLMEEYKSTTEYHASVNCNSYQSALDANESCYKQVEQSDTSNYIQKNSDINLTSYKQSDVDDVGDMDTETLDEEDGTHATDSPGIYQSYEEGMISPHYPNSALTALAGLPVVAEYNTVPNPDEKWTSASSSSIEQDVASTSNSVGPNGESYNSSTYTVTQNTHPELSLSSSKNTSSSPTLAASSQAQPLGPTSEDDHEGALCTGDQSFKTAAARQSALVPFMQTSRSMPFVPNINPSMYAGSAMVQGINGPTIMSSSSVHIAQHPGGATIMRHQTVSAGLNGGITQATLMQQQAISNGAQATAVLQQRTLTNRGQTMVLQQRTMTTGLGGMTQQTLVQQRMAAPNCVAQAMYHANAMRQRAMVNQQATLLQHRAIRLAQARVMSTQLLRAQALNGAAFLQQAGPGNPTSIIGPSLVRGGTPGSVMQQLVRQRYLGGPVMPGRGVQMVAGRPVRVKVTYTRESLPMESNT